MDGGPGSFYNKRLTGLTELQLRDRIDRMGLEVMANRIHGKPETEHEFRRSAVLTDPAVILGRDVVQSSTGAHLSASARAGRPSGEVLDGLLGLLAVLVMASSWATHVVVCAMEGLWALLVLGLVVLPIAFLHGVAVWLGL